MPCPEKSTVANSPKYVLRVVFSRSVPRRFSFVDEMCLSSIRMNLVNELSFRSSEPSLFRREWRLARLP
jgi:hypothetical protein